MGDVDETAKLWKVNRTVHELVKDRVSNHCEQPGIHNLIACYPRASKFQMKKSIWTSSGFEIHTRIALESSSK